MCTVPGVGPLYVWRWHTVWRAALRETWAERANVYHAWQQQLVKG